MKIVMKLNMSVFNPNSREITTSFPKVSEIDFASDEHLEFVADLESLSLCKLSPECLEILYYYVVISLSSSSHFCEKEPWDTLTTWTS